jgi:F-type H+-transporting ATPase subunit gamma
MANSKEIKVQIASIGNTQKITSAMEKVAVSKMKKTQDKMLKGRPYRDRMLGVISHLAKGQPEYKPKYMEERDVKKIAIIVVSSDKGLCGGLNANLLRDVTRFASEQASSGKEISYSLIGTKAQSFFKSFGGNVISATEKLGDDPSIEQLVGSMKILLDAFSEGEIDKVYLASNSFVNTMTQQPEINQLLPLSKLEDEEDEGSNKESPRWDYIYEPDDSRLLLDGLMERYIESLLYQSVIENIACEQAAKMVAMKSATDNAGSLIEELQLVYNNARQAAITQEISEIVAGAEAI